MGRYEDQDGIDGPTNRAWKAVERGARDEAKAARRGRSSKAKQAIGETFAVEVMPSRHPGVDDREPPSGLVIYPFRAPPVRLVRAAMFALASRLEESAARHGFPWALSCDGEGISIEFVNDGYEELRDAWWAVYETLGGATERDHPSMPSAAMWDLPFPKAGA